MENNNKKNEKELTLTDVIEAIKGVENRLDKKIDDVEGKLSKKIDSSVEELAIMVQKSLLNTEENIKEEIKSEKVNNKAEFNKRVYIFNHKDLEFRVEKLEEKIGMAHKK